MINNLHFTYFLVIFSCSGNKTEQLRTQTSQNTANTATTSPQPIVTSTPEVLTRCPEKTATSADLTGAFASPIERTIFQRTKNGSANVGFSLTLSQSVQCVELRVVDEQNKEILPWREMKQEKLSSSEFTKSTLTVPQGGWFRMEAAFFSSHAKGATVYSKMFGVGEVFIAAGQSNSANHGSVVQVPKSDRAVAWNGTQWLKATDPQPLASGGAGSPWPPMMDLLIDELNVPVAVISVGYGGTRSSEWLPETQLYTRLKNAINAVKTSGFRAILWHQGEHDTAFMVSTAEYTANLSKIISQSRADADFQVPWLIAKVSYIKFRFEYQPAIQEAQTKLVSLENKVFAGPTTDDMLAGMRAKDGVHFSDLGLKEHGLRWKKSISSFLSVVPE